METWVFYLSKYLFITNVRVCSGMLSRFPKTYSCNCILNEVHCRYHSNRGCLVHLAVTRLDRDR